MQLDTGGPTSLTLWQTETRINIDRTTTSYPIFKALNAADAGEALLTGARLLYLDDTTHNLKCSIQDCGMKIYTKTGDQGTTSLFGGKRVSKADLRIDTYGTVDELNSFIGLVRDQEVNQKRKNTLVEIQERLFTIGSILATEPGNTKVKIPVLLEEDISFLEKEMDAMDADLPPMRFFILPGGHQSISFAHVARTVCRRAERLTIALNSQEEIDPLVIKYLNRLSDYLFVLSRKMANELGVEETPWKPRM